MRKLRNITVRLEDDVARWARMEAARRKTSVSRFLGGILKEKMQSRHGYQRAMGRALKRKPFLNGSGAYPSREDIHERSRVR